MGKENEVGSLHFMYTDCCCGCSLFFRLYIYIYISFNLNVISVQCLSNASKQISSFLYFFCHLVRNKQVVLHGLGRVRAAFHWQRGGLQGGVPHLSPLVPFADGTACLLAQTKRFLGEQPARALVFLFFFPKTVSFLYFFFPSRVCDFPSGHILFLFCVL